MIVEGIVSQQLARDVSDQFFALLHLIVEVCGNHSSSAKEHMVYVWLTKTVPTIFAMAAPEDGFNDSVAEFFQRSKWWLMKLRFIDYLLVTGFDCGEIPHNENKDFSGLEKDKLGLRLVHGYFHLRPKKVVSFEQGASLDNECLLILITSAWQCAKALQYQVPEMWSYLVDNPDTILTGFQLFSRKISKLKTLRRSGSSGSGSTPKKREEQRELQNERISMYMLLLHAMIREITGNASDTKKLKL
jgi:hypothetical protein